LVVMVDEKMPVLVTPKPLVYMLALGSKPWSHLISELAPTLVWKVVGIPGLIVDVVVYPVVLK